MLTVWVDDWQVQCCGEPFAVGQRVTWTLGPVDRACPRAVLGEELAATLTHREDHHGGLPDDTPATTATLRSIRAASCRYEVPAAGPRRPVAGSATLQWRHAADGWEAPEGGRELVSYVVELEVTPHEVTAAG